MTAQRLFPVEPMGRVRRTDPETSRAAARRVHVPSLREQILDSLLWRGPSTDRELCKRIAPDEPLRWQSIISARSGLKKDELVVATGEVRDHRLVWMRSDVGVLDVTLRTEVL